MHKYYLDYYWKMGKPYGKQAIDPKKHECSYRIIVDPYYKRFSIERYAFGQFFKMIYDSALLDFRHLKPLEQQAWQRETLEETLRHTKCLLRNQDDRAILIEELSFENNVCRSCNIYSIHGIWLSKHRMYFKHLGDAFNGVVLYDIEHRPVMMKTYEIDPITQEFTVLRTEQWDMQHASAVISLIFLRFGDG